MGTGRRGKGQGQGDATIRSLISGGFSENPTPPPKSIGYGRSTPSRFSHTHPRPGKLAMPPVMRSLSEIYVSIVRQGLPPPEAGRGSSNELKARQERDKIPLSMPLSGPGKSWTDKAINLGSPSGPGAVTVKRMSTLQAQLRGRSPDLSEKARA